MRLDAHSLVALSLFALALAALLAVSSCKSASTCTSSAQCANGFTCNAETKTCEENVVEPEPDADTSIDAAAACPTETHACLAPAPEGWTGPVVGAQFAFEAAGPACPTGFETEEITVFEDLSATGSCSCDCPGVSSGGLCGNASIQSRDGTGVIDCNSNCLNCTQFLTPDNTCSFTGDPSDPPDLSDAPALRVSLGTISNPGTCASAIESNDLATGFSAQERYCSGQATAESCSAEGLCLPKLDDADYLATCIYQAGDHECPAAYPEKELRAEGVDDTRACSACTCSGPAVGTSCGGTVHLGVQIASQPGCASTTQVTSSGCISNPMIGAGNDMARYEPNPNFDCSASGAELSGAATETGITTFCCLDVIPEP